MNTTSLAGFASPSITKMIRMDHSHVVLMSHQYTANTAPARKAAIARMVCLALEIHAQLEEEVFYPALREVDPDNPKLGDAVPEHAEMRRLIAELRGLEATDPQHDEAFGALIRTVLHHVAEEETVLLPAAEKKMPERLSELGAAMTKRRIELAGPHIGEIAVGTLRTLPRGVLAAGAALAAAAFLIGHYSRPQDRSLFR